jgi:hypothetical protein
MYNNSGWYQYQYQHLFYILFKKSLKIICIIKNNSVPLHRKQESLSVLVLLFIYTSKLYGKD